MPVKRRPRPHLVAPPDTPASSRLHPDAAAWREQLARDYELLGHHDRLADLAAGELSRSLQARAVLDEEGLTTRNRFGELRPHPAAAIARQSADAFRRLVRELLLDVPGADSRLGGR